MSTATLFSFVYLDLKMTLGQELLVFRDLGWVQNRRKNVKPLACYKKKLL
jgi:hypothetical protein